MDETQIQNALTELFSFNSHSSQNKSEFHKKRSRGITFNLTSQRKDEANARDYAEWNKPKNKMKIMKIQITKSQENSKEFQQYTYGTEERSFSNYLNPASFFGGRFFVCPPPTPHYYYYHHGQIIPRIQNHSNQSPHITTEGREEERPKPKKKK